MSDHAHGVPIIAQVPAGSAVGDVVIYGREDCCQRFISPYEVWVGTQPGDPTKVHSQQCGGLIQVAETVRRRRKCII